MRINISIASDGELKRRELELLAYGVIPLENWVSVFVNPDLYPMKGLRAKAFSVWFPSMIDFLQGNDEFSAVKNELVRRGVEMDKVFELYSELSEVFCEVLSLFTVEEQLFIRDRRLQNVHGKLQLNTFEEHKPYLFDVKLKSIKQMVFSSAEYTSIMENYYSDLRNSSSALIEKLMSSSEFAKMSELYGTKLQMGKYFQPLIEYYGLSAACGSE